MNLLPLVRYEMLRAARLPGGFRLRFGAALMAAGVAYVILGTTALRNPSAAANGLFLILVGIATAYALLSGAVHAADAIVSEKRGRTLGLLVLTELGPVDIVLGKLAPNALQAMLTLLSILPVLAVPIALGGVSLPEFLRVASALVLVQLLSLTTGILSSVVARDIRSALTASAGVMLGLSAVPGILAWMTRRSSPPFSGAVESLSPVLHVLRSLDRYRDAGIFSAQRATLILLVALLLVSACALLARAVRRQDATSAPPPVGRARLRSIAGWRHLHFAKWLATNPVLWLQRVFDPMPALWRWSFSLALSAAVLLLAVAAFYPPASAPAFFFGVGIVVSLHIGLKLVSALGAARAVGHARAEGLLEELLVAGLKPSQIVWGYSKAVFGEARPFLVALSLANILIVSVAAYLDFGRGGWLDLIIVLCVGGGILLWLDHRTVVMSAMRYSLREADAMKAFRKVLVRVLSPGWLLMLPSLVLAVVDRDSKMAMVVAMLAYHPLLIAILWQHSRARLDLDLGFRDLAAGLEFDTDDWELRESFRRNLEWTGA